MEKNLWTLLKSLFSTNSPGHRVASESHRRLTSPDSCPVAGDHDELEPLEKAFLCAPFMHSESLLIQDQSVRLFENLGNENQLCTQTQGGSKGSGIPYRNWSWVLLRLKKQLKQPGSSKIRWTKVNLPANSLRNRSETRRNGSSPYQRTPMFQYSEHGLTGNSNLNFFNAPEVLKPGGLSTVFRLNSYKVRVE